MHKLIDGKPFHQPIDAVDPRLERLFTQSLRQQLSDLKQEFSDSDRAQALSMQMRQLVTLVLQDTPVSHNELVDVFAETTAQLHLLYHSTELSEDLKTRQFITATGSVMALQYAIHTVKDIYRVRAFLRGIDAALKHRHADIAKRPFHILYPACGPFAPLLLPLIHYYRVNHGFSASQLRITLIDIQQGATLMLERLIQTLGIQDYIHAIHTQDVMDYHSEYPVDLLVLEALQHGLTKEGHMSMARHLSQFLATDGLMIPQKITVRAFLNSGDAEFVQQWRETEYCHSATVSTKVASQRVELGNILELTRESLDKLKSVRLGEGFELLECGRVQIPRGIEAIEHKLLLYCVSATTFGEEEIKEYDSGITHPLPDASVCIDFRPKQPEADDLLLKSGDHIQFYYKLTANPGFMPTWA
jgi:hypothetical protein